MEGKVGGRPTAKGKDITYLFGDDKTGSDGYCA